MRRFIPLFLAVSGLAAAGSLEHLSTLQVPPGFAGHMAYDAGSKRLWLISYGPPANKVGPCTVMELDPADGKVIAVAELPLLGGFGPPVAAGQFLYQPVNFESKIYKINIGDREHFGAIQGTIPIPMIADLRAGGANGERLKFPWLEVTGIAVAPDGNLMLHAGDLGELITIDRNTGSVLKRTPTIKGLGGISGVRDNRGRFFLLASLDPDDAAARDKARRFDLRAPEAVPWKRSKVTLFSHRGDRKEVFWILLDGESGEPLASIEDEGSPAFASGTTVSEFQPDRDAYGRLTFLAMGPAGIVTMRWKPELNAN
jgi:hypothetical protein